MAEFLEAVRTGEDQKVVGMFTSTARQQAAALNRQFAPRGSDTASFEVGEVEHQEKDQARVKCLWTDLDPEGKPRTDEITWLMRREPEGWRISGMAAVVFDGEPALVLDFENLEETLRRIDALAEEIERRQMAASAPSKEGPPEGATGPGVLR